MRITDVKINGFGVWSGLTVERLADDMTVFYGPNEAGKTTLMQFLRTVLYGFSPERRNRYLPPVNGGQPGGALRVVTPRGPFEIHRRTGAYDSQESLGDVSLMDSQGTPQSPHQLSSLLGGLDEATFNNVFAIGLREMQELSTLNDSAAAEQLYKLTSGLDRVSLIDVMRELAASRLRILSPDGQPSQLAQLLERRENLQREIEDLAARGRRWPQLAAQRAALTQDIDQAESHIAELQKQIQSYELVLQVRDKWLERRRVEEQLAGLGVPVDLPSDALEQIELMNGRLKKLRRRLIACKRQKLEMHGELSKHVVNRNLLVQAARITALCEHGPWIGSLEQEVERLRGEVQTLEREVEARRPQIDMPAGTPKHKLPEISAKTLALLRTPAGRLNQLNKLVDRTQRDAQSVKVRTDQVMQRMTSELADLDEPSLAAALEKGGTRVAQLRRRLQLEERVDQLTLQKKELEDQSHELFDSQVMPFDRMAWLFGGFALSFLLFFSGCFGGWLWNMDGWIGFLLAIFGFGVLAVSIVTKLEWERESHRRLESSERQIELIVQQLKEAKAERDELDEALPPGGGSLDARLAQAEKTLQHLEQLAPMETQRHETGQHVEVAERRATKAAEDLKEARKNWQNALRSANLPDHLAPADVRHLVRSFKHMAVVRRQLDQRREELENRTRELASLAGRITELFADVALKADIESPQSQLKLLAASLAEQQQVAQRRDTVLQQHRKLRDRWRKFRRSFGRVTHSRRALLARANATDEPELRQMLLRQQQAATLRKQREELNQQVRLIVGDQWSEESLARELLSSNVESPEQRRNRMTARLQEGKVKLSQLHERRGQLAAEMKTLADDRRLPAAKLDLGCVEEQVVQAVRRWQALAVTGLLLESVRGTYESTRQPETLREASQYLQRLTNGHYQRIWTPIEERMLRVDDAKGQVLPLEKLSRGTREAVFLSLRLALASGYARRGITLPFILDDVLVNFDANRVKAAATLLREFARQGHQMLFFTCHEHIMKMLQGERADVRILPSRNGAEGPMVLQPITRVNPSPTKGDEPRPRRKKTEPQDRPAPVAAQVIALPEEGPIVIAPLAIVSESPLPAAEPSLVNQQVDNSEPPAEQQVVQFTRVESATTRQPAPLALQESTERRFTWQSPEMYVEEDREAVA